MLPNVAHRRRSRGVLSEPHIAALAVATGNDQGPIAVPIWYRCVPDGEARVLTPIASRRPRSIGEAGRFTLMVQRTEPTVRYVAVEGPVVRTEPGTTTQLVEISDRYLAPEPARAYRRVALAEHGPQVAILLRPQR